MALMDLIENDHGNALELRVLLDHAGQYPLGDDLESGIAADLTITANPEPHLLPQRLSSLARQKPAMARAATRLGSSMRILPSISGQSSSAKGSAVDLPAPVGASRITCRQVAKVWRS